VKDPQSEHQRLYETTTKAPFLTALAYLLCGFFTALRYVQNDNRFQAIRNNYSKSFNNPNNYIIQHNQFFIRDAVRGHQINCVA